jgi:hypothetical protein
MKMTMLATDIEIPKISVDFRNENVNEAVSKIRKIGIFFKNSTKNNNKLQSHVIQAFGKEKKLFVDSRTRWSSMYEMTSRYWELKSCVDQTLKEVKSDIKISLSDKYIYSCILKTLKPVMLTVKVGFIS